MNWTKRHLLKLTMIACLWPGVGAASVDIVFGPPLYDKGYSLHRKDDGVSIGWFEYFNETGSCDISLGSGSCAARFTVLDVDRAQNDPFDPFSYVILTQAGWMVLPDGNLVLSAKGIFENHDVVYTPGSVPGEGNLQLLDRDTSDLTASVDTVFVPYETVSPTSPVPVPAALPLFLTALAGFGLVARRKSAD